MRVLQCLCVFLPLDFLRGVSAVGSYVDLHISWMGGWPWAWESVPRLLPSTRLKNTCQNAHIVKSVQMKVRSDGGHFCSSLTQKSDDVRMAEILHAGCLVQELFYFFLGETIHCLDKDKWRWIYCPASFIVPFKQDLHFIVFTATFSDVPSGCFKCPSTTEPNSPSKKSNPVADALTMYSKCCVS